MNDREEIKNKLNILLDELGLSEETDEGKKVNFEELDSIQIISAIVEIEECFDIILDVVQIFGDEYVDIIKKAKDERWIDVILELMRK